MSARALRNMCRALSPAACAGDSHTALGCSQSATSARQRTRRPGCGAEARPGLHTAAVRSAFASGCRPLCCRANCLVRSLASQAPVPRPSVLCEIFSAFHQTLPFSFATRPCSGYNCLRAGTAAWIPYLCCTPCPGRADPLFLQMNIRHVRELNHMSHVWCCLCLCAVVCICAV